MSGTKVKILKTSNWAINPPYPGELYLTEGEIKDDIPQQLIDRMIASDTEWIEVLEIGSSHHVLDDVSDIRATLSDIVDGADDKYDAKEKLEKWGRENLSFEVDKRRSLDNVIADLIAEYEEQNG